MPQAGDQVWYAPKDIHHGDTEGTEKTGFRGLLHCGRTIVRPSRRPLRGANPFDRSAIEPSGANRQAVGRVGQDEEGLNSGIIV